ncbi:MAG TPA: histidine phosphatase family protein [Thermoguttaceae bacterium]|nr:histidine phosphatase family protein [Thermoguttaceae bacterium]
MLLYCIRHGESCYNAQGRIQGQSDVPLSELGLRQSEAVAAALAGEGVEALYASPLRRAMQTAGPVADALQVEIRTDPRLMEVHAGVFQDKLRTDLEQLYPEEIARWQSGDPDFVIPGGESRRQLMHRGHEVFDEIRRTGHEQVVVVTHGGLLSAALKSLLEIPAEKHPFVFQNGSITRLEWTDGEVKLHALNQIDHLHQVGFSGRGDL